MYIIHKFLHCSSCLGLLPNVLTLIDVTSLRIMGLAPLSPTWLTSLAVVELSFVTLPAGGIDVVAVGSGGRRMTRGGMDKAWCC